MITLGFGCIETEQREKIKKLLLGALLQGKNVHDISTAWNAKHDCYDKMSREEAPERYTRFWVYDGAIHYHHIHRRHPFSPDGWAILQITEPLCEHEGQPMTDDERQEANK